MSDENKDDTTSTPLDFEQKRKSERNRHISDILIALSAVKDNKENIDANRRLIDMLRLKSRKYAIGGEGSGTIGEAFTRLQAEGILQSIKYSEANELKDEDFGVKIKEQVHPITDINVGFTFESSDGKTVKGAKMAFKIPENINQQIKMLSTQE